jgi:ketosteroid isomerase-like protein
LASKEICDISLTSMTPITRLAAYHTALDARDFPRVASMLAPDARYVSVGLGDVVGRDAIMRAMRDYFERNPDHQSFDDELEQRDSHTAISHWRLRATNKVTGEVVMRTGVETVTFTDEGLIAMIDVRDLT